MINSTSGLIVFQSEAFDIWMSGLLFCSSPVKKRERFFSAVTLYKTSRSSVSSLTLLCSSTRRKQSWEQRVTRVQRLRGHNAAGALFCLAAEMIEGDKCSELPIITGKCGLGRSPPQPSMRPPSP